MSGKSLKSGDYYCEHTSLHGVGNAYRATGKGARCSWVIIMIIVTSGLIVIMLQITTGFMNTPTATSNLVENLDHMPFPDIVFCQNRPLSWAFIKEKNISEDLAYYAQLVLTESAGIFEKYYNSSTIERLEKEYHKVLEPYNGDVRAFFMDGGPKCTDLMRLCVVRGSEHDCCSLLRPIFDAQNGRCFLFEGNRSYQIYENIGINVVISLFPEKYFPALTTNSKGATLRITPTYRPFDMSNVRIPLRGFAEISMERRSVEWSNTFWKVKCDDSSPHATSGECGYHCKHKMMVAHCGCSGTVDLEDLEPDKTIRVCSPKQLFHCVSNGSVTEEWLQDFNECRRHCLPRCVKKTLSQTVSYSTFAPSHFVLDGLNLEPDDGEMILLYASIFYPNFQLTKVTEVQTITIESVVGNIGGAMGVFLGASIISVIELFELFGKILYEALWVRQTSTKISWTTTYSTPVKS